MQRQVCTAPGWTATRLDGSVCSGIRAHKRFLSDAREATMQRCCWSHAWWWTSALVTTAPRATGIFIVCSGECPAARLFPNTTCVVCVRLRVLPPNRVTSVCRPSRGVSKGDGRWCGNLGGGDSERSSEGCLLGLMTVMRLVSSVVFFLTGSLWQNFLFSSLWGKNAALKPKVYCGGSPKQHCLVATCAE